MAKYGLAADNLLAAELVTAAGEVLQVDAASHPDLFWALRGGGGNFGVATRSPTACTRSAMVTGGLIAHPIEAAPELLRFYRDAVADAPDDLTVFAGLGARARRLRRPSSPRWSSSTPGTPSGGARAGAVPGVRITADGRGRPDAVPGDEHAARRRRSPTARSTTGSRASPEGLPDALIDTAVERFGSTPSPMSSILFEHFHGAVTRVGPSETAVPHREPGWNLLVPSVWTDPAGTDANVAWTRETYAEPPAAPVDPPVAQLPGRRPGRRRHPGGLRPQLRAAP